MGKTTRNLTDDENGTTAVATANENVATTANGKVKKPRMKKVNVEPKKRASKKKLVAVAEEAIAVEKKKTSSSKNKKKGVERLSKTGRRKLLKHPNTPWTEFYKANQHDPSFAGLKMSEVSSKLSLVWRVMNAEQKEPYYMRAQQDKERFKTEKEGLSEVDKKRLRAHNREKKKRRKGKSVLSSFMIYSNEHRARVKEQNPDIQFQDYGKMLGAEWRALSLQEKQVYKDRRAVLKAAKDAQEAADKKAVTEELQTYQEQQVETIHQPQMVQCSA